VFDFLSCFLIMFVVRAFYVFLHVFVPYFTGIYFVCVLLILWC